jgi:hypothetical protein
VLPSNISVAISSLERSFSIRRSGARYKLLLGQMTATYNPDRFSASVFVV